MTTPFNLASFADKVSSTGTANPSAISDIANTSTGALGFPVGTTAQRNGTPVNGMTRINSTTGVLEVYYNSTWTAIYTFPNVVGQQAYTTAGSFTWVAPAGVSSVCVVCVGGGGAGYYTGGGGGGLGWKNNISVIAGQSYLVVVGSGGAQPGGNGGNSYFIDVSTVKGGGGGAGQTDGTTRGIAGTYTGDGGGNGGTGGNGYECGGGGAGGYSGNGGNGGDYSSSTNLATDGAGGGGGGGAADFTPNAGPAGGGGGGVFAPVGNFSHWARLDGHSRG